MAVAAHVGVGVGVGVQQMAGVRDQFFAGFSQIGALADALDQRDLEAALQLLHLMRHRGLRQVELLAAAVTLPRSITSTNALN